MRGGRGEGEGALDTTGRLAGLPPFAKFQLFALRCLHTWPCVICKEL